MEGQWTLSTNDQGSWNMEEQYLINNNKYNNEFWGDCLTNKSDGCIRVVSKNIQGLGVTAGNSKEDELKSCIVNKSIDLIGIQEPNVNWYKCKNRDRFSERIIGPEWKFVRYSVAFNKHDNKSKQQFGGSITMGFDQITHRVSGSGADERGLGRWSWVLLKGKKWLSCSCHHIIPISLSKKFPPPWISICTTSQLPSLTKN